MPSWIYWEPIWSSPIVSYLLQEEVFAIWSGEPLVKNPVLLPALIAHAKIIDQSTEEVSTCGSTIARRGSPVIVRQ
jgi:hypothetical protein